MVPNVTKGSQHIFEIGLRNFFMNFFMFSEVYFRSPFGHLPVTFAQTLIVSSPIFSANLEPFRARLRGLEAEKRCFHTPPVYKRENLLGLSMAYDA